jgi:protein subunit release factor A
MKNFNYTKKDFKIEWFNGGVKAGGQAINKHDNCVKITHIVSGIQTQSTSHRNRKANFKQAFHDLGEKVKVWIIEQINKDNPQRVENNEIIRTYHNVDNRIKDHVSGYEMSWSELDKQFDDLIVARKKGLINVKN